MTRVTSSNCIDGIIGLDQVLPSRLQRLLLAPTASELERWQKCERAVRAHGVVVDAPELGLDARPRDRGEVGLPEELVGEFAVEALDECVLNRFAWLDEIDRDAVLARPSVDDKTDELRTVVDDEQRGIFASLRPQMTFRDLAAMPCIAVERV